ncbi:U3 snoRNP protein [Exophiala xenobiotica]|uniref:U3 snoRNP protein n=1 Tax=Lithohypha guttulata TaxID=1690604 RepID=A0ABR0KK50_9EURO|nr:U3 snoRNP protein [Lithohypha guttulata]KAK5322792.1 U3 snoRNP protein [Exophiala xenobiotica]
MSPISPGRPAGPPRKARKQTATTKAHRYEPFTKRVAKLKIDPVHKVQQSRLKETSDDISQSYFRAALEEWSELNLTTTFTSFYYQVNGLCESLPQLLHHADRIVQSLLEHIEKQEPLALEALLSLVAHLAHDLGQEFEKYFAHTVKLVAKVSTAQDDPAVVEACFTCLAWIYKYLSRLFVQDLRPLLDILLPYFSARKEYIRRFTAESLAFLVRKAAVLYPKNQKPLTRAIEHVIVTKVRDLNEKEQDAYVESSRTLLAESAAGVDAALHTSAPELFTCLCRQVSSPEQPDPIAVHILEGLTVNLVHRTDAPGFRPVLDVIVEAAEQSDKLLPEQALVSRLLLIALATRGGSRVSDWSTVLQLLPVKLRAIALQHEPTKAVSSTLVKAVASAIENAPLDQLLPSVPKLVAAVIDNTSPCQFFTFCETVASLNRSRFQDLILPHLQHYIVSRWGDNEAGLVVLLDDLQQQGTIHKQAGKSGYVAISDQWEASLRTEWQKVGFRGTSTQAEYIHLLMARSIQFPKSLQAVMEYRNILAKNVRSALSDTSDAIIDRRIHLGWGFATLVNLPEGLTTLSNEDWIALMAQEEDMFQLLPFVQALADAAAKSPATVAPLFSNTHARPFLVRNMLNSSLELRKASLKVLELVHGDTSDWLRQAIELLQEILDTEYSIGNARQLAMLLRRLPVMQKNVSQDPTFSKLIPTFTLGLLPNYHDKLRRDVSSALSQMVTDSEAEELVLETIKDWLQAPIEPPTASASPSEELSDRVSIFECTRLNEMDSAYLDSTAHLGDPALEIKTRVESAHALLTLRTPFGSRSIALQVLLDMPQIVEKRSKILVPAFLAAQRGRTGHDPNIHDESHSVNTLSPDIEERGWSLKERKLFLQLIGQFTNPRMLYRAEDVYTMLLELLANGDAETRKLALLAILKWKNRALISHQDALLRVAEDKTTSSELALMLSSDSESGTIQDQSRAEVLPVLLRLIFGQLIGRVGVHGSQEAKRKSLLRLLFRIQESEVLMFLDIVLGRLREVTMTDADREMQKHFVSQDLINADQQYGFLRMASSMLEILQLQFRPFGHKILDAVLYCTTRACHKIEAFEAAETAPALVRNTRRSGIQCLNLIFEYCPELELQLYRSLLWDELIRPRVPNFTTENSQGVSGLLKMFSVWARSRHRLQLLVTETYHILESCWSLLASEHAKATVKVFVIDEIIGSLLDLADNGLQDSDMASSVIRAEAPQILDKLAVLLQQSPPKDTLLTVTSIVQRLETHVEAVATRRKIVELLVDILGEPNQRLPPHVKGQVLKAIKGLAQSNGVLTGTRSTERLFELICSYFDFFRDLPNRQSCAQILRLIAQEDERIRDAADICEDLNACSTVSLDEVNHDRQSAAFSKVHTILDTQVSGRSFLPILHNLIFLTRSTDDAAIRGNALGCIKHLVKSTTHDPKHTESLAAVLLQAIRKHIKDDSETVRADFAELLGAVVQHWKALDRLQDMEVLLVGNDEEASFFNNILHIQQHRRNRAIRRLIVEVETGKISEENIADYFLPLLQKFATDTGTSESAQATKGQSIASMTVLLQWLDWKTFRRVFRQYRPSLENKTEDDKVDVRLLDHAADALTAAVEKRTAIENKEGPVPHLTKCLPPEDIVAQELKTNFIPKLAELSHYRDEGEISQRIPAAVVAVKLISLLPASETSLLATPVILDVAQVLRSRTQETRDLARNKLAEIVTLLGSTSVQFVLKELRTALTQGYQLHVLSYTMHTILLATAEQRAIGDLDYCLEDLVKVILDDVFGAVGQQKDNQDYISSMKEVKRNKSFDSMEILAKCTSVKHLAELVLPFEALLTGSLSSKRARHIDELFRRIGVGISHSPAASSQELLVFAFELIQSFYRVKPSQPPRRLTNDEKNRARYIVQKDNTQKVGTVSSSSLLYKLAKFAIDIARSTFARHSELMTPQNVHGFLPIVGDALVEGQEDVKISAMRLLSTVIKLRLPELEENAKLYVMEAVKVVKGAVTTNEEAAQAALKLVSAIIREQSQVEVRDSDIAYILKRTMPDLEEPDRQGVTFNFLKAVMARQMQMPEIYELVDKIGLMMVTSQSRSSRDAARGVYVHFQLDYPQGKARWSKQVKFLVKNLEYQYPEGRQSIMEASSTLLSKLDKDTAQELAAVMFVPIVLRMANDENEQCRELAGALLSQLFRRTRREGLLAMLEPLRAWLEQGDNLMLKKISLQTWSIYFKVAENASQDELSVVKDQLLPVLRESDEDESAWELQYHALELIHVLADVYPQSMLTTKQRTLWETIIAVLDTHHTWLQNSASRLVQLYFRECISAGCMSIPLSCSPGLSFQEDMVVKLLRSSVKVLKHQSTTTEQAEIVVQNLLFLSRCVDASGTRVAIKAAANGIENGADNDIESDDEGVSADANVVDGETTMSIPATQYLLDQAALVLRREPKKYTAAAIRPKLSFMSFLTYMFPHLSTTTTNNSHPSITFLLVPLLHFTSTTTNPPRSIDPAFSMTYQTMIENAQVLLEAVQAKVGDRTYAKLITTATKQARERRQERRNKRAIDTIAEPEKATQDKRRKFERKKDRRKEVKGMHRSNRRKDLGF